MTNKLAITKIVKAYWFLPTIYSIFAILLGILSNNFDRWVSNQDGWIFPSILFANFDLSIQALSTISASIMTMTTITFSTIMVVLTTFLSQYSPRTLQNFINDPPTQRVLASFVSGVVYTLTLLILIKSSPAQDVFITPFFGSVAIIINLFVFVFFIHHVSNWVKVSRLVHNITAQTNKKIETSFLLQEFESNRLNVENQWLKIKKEKPLIIVSHKTGYIQQVNIQALIRQASDDNCMVQFLKSSGEYILKGNPLFYIWGDHRKLEKTIYALSVTIGIDKEPIEDIEFGIRKLTEVALRAISPAINDPNTARNCIEEIGVILAELSKRPLPDSFFTDEYQNLRLYYEQPSFQDYLYKSFYQLRHYGKKDISVILEIFKALKLIVESNDKEIQNLVWNFHEYIIEGVDFSSLQELDLEYLSVSIDKLAHACDRSDFNREKWKKSLNTI